MTQFKYFGTDGIRGEVGQVPVTADFILKLGWAIGKVMGKSNDAGVLVGKDTRISGYMFESALQAGLVASGTNIQLSGPLSTPAIAYLTRTFSASAGIVISASHNGFEDNGIKIFSSDGIKISDRIQKRIEDIIEQPLQTVPAAELGRASRITDATGRYVEFCKGTLSKHLSLKGFRIVLDCANGATYSAAPLVFGELGAEVIAIGIDPDGYNINKQCGSTHPERAIEEVRKYRADLGVVLDGDGDRVVMIDHTGELLDGDDLLFILAAHWHGKGKLDGGIVGTEVTNMGLEVFCKEQGIDFARVPVGDRNVVAELEANNWWFGGESSGHIVCTRYNSTGDGIIAALQIIRVLIEQKTRLHQAKKNYQRYHQETTNLDCADSQPLGRKSIKQIINSYQKQLSNQGRILVRKSGTEQKLRILVESQSAELVKKYSEQLTTDIQKILVG